MRERKPAASFLVFVLLSPTFLPAIVLTLLSVISLVRLTEMVHEVNQSVSPETKLSDNVYTYDFDNHQLVLAGNGQTEEAATVMSM